jgi:hypothetical protein
VLVTTVANDVPHPVNAAFTSNGGDHFLYSLQALHSMQRAGRLL